jgi:hypothetical protein
MLSNVQTAVYPSCEKPFDLESENPGIEPSMCEVAMTKQQ